MSGRTKRNWGYWIAHLQFPRTPSGHVALETKRLDVDPTSDESGGTGQLSMSSGLYTYKGIPSHLISYTCISSARRCLNRATRMSERRGLATDHHDEEPRRLKLTWVMALQSGLLTSACHPSSGSWIRAGVLNASVWDTLLVGKHPRMVKRSS